MSARGDGRGWFGGCSAGLTAWLAAAAWTVALAGCAGQRAPSGGTASTAPVITSALIGEQLDTQPESGQLWFDRRTADQATALLGSTNRLVSIQVAQPPPNLTFSGTYVPNSGTYARTWYWYPALTVDQLQLFTEVLSARPISLDMYMQGNTTMLATVLVRQRGRVAGVVVLHRQLADRFERHDSAAQRAPHRLAANGQWVDEQLRCADGRQYWPGRDSVVEVPGGDD